MPTSNEPVKVAPSNSGLSTSACPMVEPGPVTKFTTPSGKPASRRHSAYRRTIQAVSVAGLMTTVLPAVSAAPVGPPVNAKGKLNGLMTSHTPYGFSTDMFVAS